VYVVLVVKRDLIGLSANALATPVANLKLPTIRLNEQPRRPVKFSRETELSNSETSVYSRSSKQVNNRLFPSLACVSVVLFSC
jgi:hypothetical protein